MAHFPGCDVETWDPFCKARLGRKRRRLLQRLARRKEAAIVLHSSREGLRAQILTVDGEGHAVIIRRPDGSFLDLRTMRTASSPAALIWPE